MPSPSSDKIPTMCSCGKYPWSEVAIRIKGKSGPDLSGSQVNDNPVFIQPGVSLTSSSHSCSNCKCANKEEKDKEKDKEKRKKELEKEVDLTDCGLEECKSEEFKMLTPFDPNISDNTDSNQESDEEYINQSANDLAIDG